MPATWAVITLLAVAQTGDELPQRLPPLPQEFAPSSVAPSFAPPVQPAQFTPPESTQPSYSLPNFPVPPQQVPPATGVWIPPQPQPLGLPPPPATSAAPAWEATGEAPPLELNEPTWDEPALPGTRLSFVTLGAGTGFSTTALDVNHTWLLGYGEAPPVHITPGFGLHFWGDGVGLGLPARVYDLYLDMQWTPWAGDLWSVTVGLTPGIYSDFAQASGDAFQLTGWIVGNRQLTEDWQLVVGAAYIRQLQTTVIPVGGVIWTPDDDVRLELIFPKPKYAVRYRETMEGSRWLFLAAQLGGGAWAVADGPNDDALVGYSDWRILLGIESFRVDGREWSLELGYAFARELTIDNWHVASPGSSFSFSASLAF